VPAFHGRTQWYRTCIVLVSQIAFWLGMILFFLGSIISFYPGSEAGWYATAAILVGFGFFVPSKGYRIAAFMIVAICLFWTFTGYNRGMEYQEWMKSRRL
jgi:type II secretory pathway component PulF